MGNSTQVKKKFYYLQMLIGKKTGDGLFGISFKIKGPTNNLKTTVNPVKTLTPRFITRTLEEYKKKESR